MPGPPLIFNSWDTAHDAVVDARALTLLSASSPLFYNNLTGAFTIQQASGAQAGFLSAADWAAFNSKQSALTIGNFTEVTSSILTITGGTGAIIGSGLTVAVAQSGVATSGYLSTTDWNTFNGKQNSLTLPLSIANGGTNNAGPFTAGSVIFSNGTALTQDNAAFFWDDTNKAFCVGTVTQAAALTVVAQIAGQKGCSIIGANAAAVASAVGGGFSFVAGTGGSPATGTAGAGGAFVATAGAGGTSTNLFGGIGGAFTFTAGNGGVAARAAAAGPTGGAFNMSSGVGGTNTLAGGSGNGGQFTLQAGAGGACASSGAGGLGGGFSLLSGPGGANTSTGAGGKSGAFIIAAGAGGNTPASAGTPGAGGTLTISGGNAGTSADAVKGNVGGSIFLNPGQGSAGSANGLIVFGQFTTDLVNFIAGSGAGVPVNGVTPAAWIACQRNGVAGFIPWYQ